MATPKSTPTVARLIVAAAYALEHYDAGDLPAALAALDGMEADPLPDHPCWLAAALAQRSAVTMRGALALAVARNWMAEARHRLRRELGEDILGAVTPVRRALRSALHCVEGLCMTSTTDADGPDRVAGLVALTDACHTEARPERDCWRGLRVPAPEQPALREAQGSAARRSDAWGSPSSPWPWEPGA